MSIIRKIEGSIVLEDETLSHLPKSKTWPIWAKRLKYYIYIYGKTLE